MISRCLLLTALSLYTESKIQLLYVNIYTLLEVQHQYSRSLEFCRSRRLSDRSNYRNTEYRYATTVHQHTYSATVTTTFSRVDFDTVCI